MPLLATCLIYLLLCFYLFFLSFFLVSIIIARFRFIDSYIIFYSSHIKLLTSLDASWATNSNNGLHALGHPHWLRLQFATAKLLDLALLLPATTLPQFQMQVVNFLALKKVAIFLLIEYIIKFDIILFLSQLCMLLFIFFF